VVPSSIATTQWSKEKERTRKLVERVIDHHNGGPTADSISAISEAAVDFIVYTSLTEPENMVQIVDQLGDSSRSGTAPFLARLLTTGFLAWFVRLFHGNT